MSDQVSFEELMGKMDDDESSDNASNGTDGITENRNSSKMSHMKLPRSKKLGNIVSETLKNIKVCDYYDILHSELNNSESESEEVGEKKKFRDEVLNQYIYAAFPKTTTATLSVRKLANRICEAIDEQGPDISVQEKRKFYELCFVLVLMTSKAIDYFIKDPYDEYDYYFTQSDMLLKAAPSLLCTIKLNSLHGENFHGDGLMDFEDFFNEMETEVLLDNRLSAHLIPINSHCMSWLIARYGPDEDNEMSVQHSFIEYFQQMEHYGGERIASTDDIRVFARELVSVMVREIMRNKESVRVMELYELCYVFIRLMADERAEQNHVTLMEMNNVPGYKDWYAW